MCTKIGYKSRKEAFISTRNSNSTLRPYLCACGLWHVTSMTGRQLRALRKRHRLVNEAGGE